MIYILTINYSYKAINFLNPISRIFKDKVFLMRKYILLIHPNYILLKHTKSIFTNFYNLLSTLSTFYNFLPLCELFYYNNVNQNQTQIHNLVQLSLFVFLCLCARPFLFCGKMPMSWNFFKPFLTKYHINLYLVLKPCFNSSIC